MHRLAADIALKRHRYGISIVLVLACLLGNTAQAAADSYSVNPPSTDRLASKQFRIAIIDRFFPPVGGFASDEDRRLKNQMYGLLDLDSDQQPEPLYHGDLVRMIAAHPQFSFIHYPMRNGATPMQEILLNLQKIHQRLAIQPLDALVLSWESSTLISAFEKPLQLAHAKHYQQVVRDWGKANASWQATYEIILMLERLAAAGVHVYTIAGNGGRGMINTFSLAAGVITVGAVEPELARFVADNIFVDVRAQAAYRIERIDDAEGRPLGYDINNDQCPDIPLQRLSGFGNGQHPWPKNYWKPLKGSSFAAPKALKAHLLASDSDGSNACLFSKQLMAQHQQQGTAAAAP